MKKMLLFTSLLFPAISFAEGVELGVNVGYNTSVFSAATPSFPSLGLSNESANGMCISLKVIGNISKHGQFGFGLDIGWLTQPIDIYVHTASGLYHIEKDQKIAKPYFHPYLMGNYVFPIGLVRLYVGPNMGLLIAKGETYDINYNSFYSYLPKNFLVEENTIEAGFSLGAQICASIDLGSNMDFNIEAAPRTINFNGSYLIPVTLGLHFRF